MSNPRREVELYIERCAKGKRFMAKLNKISGWDSEDAKMLAIKLEEELYDKAQGKFEGVEGYGTSEQWGAESSDWSWVYWYCVGVVEDYIKQKVMSKKIVLKDIQQGKVIARRLASKIIAEMEMYVDNDIKSEEDEGVLGGQYPLGEPLTLEHFVKVVEERIDVYLEDYLDLSDPRFTLEEVTS